MGKVFIGVDPHKLSATIEVVDEQETVVGSAADELAKLAEWNAEQVKSAIQSVSKRLGARGPQLVGCESETLA